jgi:recombination protein RecA
MAKATSEVLSREDRIAKICETINKGSFGGENKDAVTWLGSRDVVLLERFPSGDHELDKALGGGWPKGRFVEIYGPEAGGKSTMCLHAIAEHQKKYPNEDVALIDLEFSFDESYAIALGVNTKWLIVHQPDSGEQALNVLSQLIQLGVGLIVFDSVAALTTKNELEGDFGDDHVAVQARLMSQSLRRLTAEAGKKQATVFWTNQMREKIGISYGDKTTTPAGRALKHYASIRCSIRKISTQKETINGEEVCIANEVGVDVKKNKTAAPFRSVKFFIVFGRGIDPVISVFDAAVKSKIIEKRGAWFSFEGEQLGQGRANIITLLQENKELFNRVRDKIQNTKPSIQETEETKLIKKPVLRDDDDIDTDIDTDVEVFDV